MLANVLYQAGAFAACYSTGIRSLGAGPCSGLGTEMYAQRWPLGASTFTSSLRRQGLDPWDSEPPGGTFLPSPAQLPAQPEQRFAEVL